MGNASFSEDEINCHNQNHVVMIPPPKENVKVKHWELQHRRHAWIKEGQLESIIIEHIP